MLSCSQISATGRDRNRHGGIALADLNDSRLIGIIVAEFVCGQNQTERGVLLQHIFLLVRHPSSPDLRVNLNVKLPSKKDAKLSADPVAVGRLGRVY